MFPYKWNVHKRITEGWTGGGGTGIEGAGSGGEGAGSGGRGGGKRGIRSGKSVTIWVRNCFCLIKSS